MRFVPWKDRKSVCADLRHIYAASSLEAAEAAEAAFEATWGERFPMIVDLWRLRWSEIFAFFFGECQKSCVWAD